MSGEEIKRLVCDKRQSVIISDWQLTQRIERLLGRKENGWAISALAFGAGQEAVKSDYLFSTGDMVSAPTETNWRRARGWFGTWSDTRIPMMGVLGNHDYGGSRDARDARRLFFSHFPDQNGECWFARLYGPVAIIGLDSNARGVIRGGGLSPDERTAQDAWFAHTLEQIENMPEVGGILVLVHHPPYSNAWIVRGNRRVRRTFLSRLRRSSKPVVMACGHVHGYARFHLAGDAEQHPVVCLIVGGGGPRMYMQSGIWRRRLHDHFSGPAERPYHFCSVAVTSACMEFEMHALVSPDNYGTFEVQDRFTVPLAPHTYVMEEYHAVEGS